MPDDLRTIVRGRSLAVAIAVLGTAQAVGQFVVSAALWRRLLYTLGAVIAWALVLALHRIVRRMRRAQAG